jgi:nucleotidyltransferase substrate binding protein (TIGR01987 family)
MEITESLKKRYVSVKDALEELKESIDIIAHDSVGKTHYKHMRNSEIQSFEFTLDTFWKLLKEYLLSAYKVSVEVPTPKKVFRESLNVRFITDKEFEILLQAMDARNISHTYHEELAEEIAGKIPGFYTIISAVFNRIVVD